MNARQTILLITTAITLIGANVWAFQEYTEARRSAWVAKRDLGRCVQFAERIKQLRKQPELARAQAIERPELVRQIETVARAVQLPARSLNRIHPEPPLRISNSAFQRVSVRLALQDVTIKQLTRFLYQITDSYPSLKVGSCRIAAPRNDRDQNMWNADVVLTYLVYSPHDKLSAPEVNRP